MRRRISEAREREPRSSAKSATTFAAAAIAGAVLRLYHRSGAWGVYSINADEGTMVGVGLRARF
ncbi:MAG: hypothetical protein KGJ75_16335 [Alphaproteobacteria bacterium]|nr:hypothetical protein [Alphaproteobacteria bacterium]MDE2075123.1 hypothetical protein [Alphaproteobacteria bacterium]MDE2353220.1 hypothetical protein [Alphaproteobacteria bacterium]